MVQIYGRHVAIAERLMVSRSVVLTKFVMEEPPFGIRRPEFAAAADDLNFFLLTGSNYRYLNSPLAFFPKYFQPKTDPPLAENL